MSSKTFAPAYVQSVLAPAYRNWSRFFLPHLLRIQKAHLCMLVENRIIPEAIGRQLHDRLDWLAVNWQPPEEYPAQLGVEDLYFLIERELSAWEGEEVAAWLHTARSRNDMDTTAFRMALREALLSFYGQLLELCTGIARRASLGRDELTVLYTHGQPANPSTTEHYLTAWLVDLVDDLGALREAVACVDSSTMGACAITGTGFPIDRQRVAELLGFATLDLHTYRAIAGSHWLVAPAQALQRLMIDIGRFVADLLHKASVEVGLYTFDDYLVQISSIMPQKRNPVILEHLRIQAGQVAGTCNAIIASFMNVPYQDVNENADAPVARLLEIMPLASSVLDLLETALEGMRGNTGRAREICRLFGVTTTELADTLVRQEHVGFRAAHGVSAAYALSGGDIETLRRAWRDCSGTELQWQDEDIRTVLDPDHFVQVRATPGGPAPEGMAPVHAMLTESMHQARQWLISRQVQLARADEELEKAWRALGRQ
ncbi:MAG: lyase family protein [Rectinemataceae bacterium]